MPGNLKTTYRTHFNRMTKLMPERCVSLRESVNKLNDFKFQILISDRILCQNFMLHWMFTACCRSDCLGQFFFRSNYHYNYFDVVVNERFWKLSQDRWKIF